jgi:hypothetical protein
MLQAIKKPRTFSGGASGSDDAIVYLRAHASRGPGGLSGFRGAFGVVIMARAYAGDFDQRQRLLDGKSASTRLKRASLLRDKLTHEPSQSL